jgi:hypothetical protein
MKTIDATHSRLEDTKSATLTRLVTFALLTGLVAVGTAAMAQDQTLTNGEVVLEEEVDVIELSDEDVGVDSGNPSLTTKTNTNHRRGLPMTIGHPFIRAWSCYNTWMPPYIMDQDGGSIRLIMQHKVHRNDQVRVIDLHIGMEWTDNGYGHRGRYPGRYGWTRQSGGGNYAWILGDNTAHQLAYPWGWFRIVDFNWLNGNALLGGNRIRLCSHPDVTTRVVFLD